MVAAALVATVAEAEALAATLLTCGSRTATAYRRTDRRTCGMNKIERKKERSQTTEIHRTGRTGTACVCQWPLDRTGIHFSLLASCLLRFLITPPF
uniref:Putative secreted protein n=1 Tax=Anopheles triannulatus TaxID=58253 RepID=A0A2M4B2K9_9DIPT